MTLDAKPTEPADFVATTSEPVAWPPPSALWAFLAAGLLPGLFAARRLPVGLWHMAWGWTWIVGALLLLPLVATYRRPRPRRILRAVVVTLAIASGLAFVMCRLSLADARHEPLPPDGWIFGLAVLLQLVIAAAVLVRLRSKNVSSMSVVQAGVGMGAVIVVALVLVLVGRSLPAPFLVVAVALAAARIALLPVSRSPSRSALGRFGTQAMLLAWAVAVVGLETRTSTREGGFTTVVSALVIGLAVLVALSDDSTIRSRIAISPVVAIMGVTLIGGLAILVPSEQSAHWLHDWNFNAPSTFSLAGERYDDGALSRWYDTRLTGPEAELAAHQGFSSFVSEWTAPDPFGIDGHVWGYQLDVRIWDLRVGSRADLPPEHLCHTETGTCVLVRLRRSDDLDNDPVEPTATGAQYDEQLMPEPQR